MRSLVVVTISDAQNGEGNPSLALEVQTVPTTLPERPVSALAPGAESSLVLIRHVGIESVPMQIHSRWESPTGRVFVSSVDVAGKGPSAASLIECPVDRVGWGNLTDATVPGAVLTEGDTEIPAPPPVTAESGLTCGAAVTLRAVGNAGALSDIRLETRVSSSGAAVPEGAPDLFGNIRRVLDTEEFAGRLSSNLVLLPAPGAQSSTP